MKKSSYEFMRIIVMFDLPVDTKESIKKYTKFREFLMDDGFIMIQYSIYSRFCHNLTDCDKHIMRIKQKNPKIGNVRILKITENQYENMIILYGEVSENEKVQNKELIVVE